MSVDAVMDDSWQLWLEWVRSEPILFVVLYILWTIAGLPGTPVTIAAGWLYTPPAYALALVLVGACTGGSIAFSLTRWLLHDLMQKRASRIQGWRNIGPAIEKHGWLVVFLLRLIPIMPYSLLSYALGLTTIKASHFFIASLLGILPCSLAYVYAGAAAQDVSELLDMVGLGPADEQADPSKRSKAYALVAVVVACVIAVWALSVWARRWLNRLAAVPAVQVEVV